ncbi:MAG: tRNA pseudouridine(55) synthase TruB [Lachnospiraceae bacterium]|nr:tRNA pseudouridine(55) synthase TruB [Lachnospiraceae bacterium]
MNGIINIYKEPGFTSHDAVAKLRGILKQKKIGHTGTLDPEAAGVLPVCLGNATKVCEMLTDATKEYVAVLLLGTETDTYDITGQILSRKEEEARNTGKEELLGVLDRFRGEILQEPPMYSALKVDGKRLYELARRGIEVERKKRPVTVYELELLEADPPRFRLRIVCSKGTYIRSLCHDIGKELSVGGCMESLLRTRVGSFEASDSVKLSAIEEKIREAGAVPGELSGLGLGRSAVTVDELFAELPAIRMKEEADRILLNGNPLKPGQFDVSKSEKVPGNGKIRAFDSGGSFRGIYEKDAEKGIFMPVKLFL